MGVPLRHLTALLLFLSLPAAGLSAQSERITFSRWTPPPLGREIAPRPASSGGTSVVGGVDAGLARQQADIRMGKDRLAALLGEVDPIFTPPWNRCTQETVSALAREGFRVLSREAKAAPLSLHGLYHLPVSVDWRRRRGDVRESPSDTAAAMAEQVRGGAARVGLMLHHQNLDSEDLDALDALLNLVQAAPNARLGSMMEFVEDHNVSLIGA